MSNRDKYGKTYIDYIDEKIMPFIRYDGYDCRYPTISPVYFDNNFYEEIRVISEKLFKIFVKTVKVFQQCPDDFMDKMEIPQKLKPYLNIPNVLNLPTWLSRFDYVFDKDYNLKMVEINADTPCAIVESYYGNGIASEFFNADNPNDGEYVKLQYFLKSIADKTSNLKVNLNTYDFHKSQFLFSCFHDYIEDYGTTMFLLNALKQVNDDYKVNLSFESFYDLKVSFDDHVEMSNGEYANTLYRLHPMELLIEEQANDGDDLGILFMEGYKNGKFKMFNPPEAIIMQSKGFQALVWALANIDDSPFDDDEIAIVKQYMLPSYFEDDYKLLDKRLSDKWIVKPIWGREGNGIKVVDQFSTILVKEVPNPEDIVQRDSLSKLYQYFVEQPTFIAETDYAENDPGYLTLSCFMLGDKSSAVYSRFSYEQVSGMEAFWIPSLIKKKN